MKTLLTTTLALGVFFILGSQSAEAWRYHGPYQGWSYGYYHTYGCAGPRYWGHPWGYPRYWSRPVYWGQPYWGPTCYIDGYGRRVCTYY